MLTTLIARYRAWQLKLTTIRQLDHIDDRLLADMGIARDSIVTLATRNAAASVKAKPATRRVQTIAHALR